MAERTDGSRSIRLLMTVMRVDRTPDDMTCELLEGPTAFSPEGQSRLVIKSPWLEPWLTLGLDIMVEVQVMPHSVRSWRIAPSPSLPPAPPAPSAPPPATPAAGAAATREGE